MRVAKVNSQFRRAVFYAMILFHFLSFFSIDTENIPYLLFSTFRLTDIISFDSLP